MKNPFSRFIFAAGFGLTSLIHAAIRPGEATEPFTARELRQGYRDNVVLAKPRASRRATAEADEQREGMRVRRRWERFGGLRELEVRPGETPAQAVARLRATGRYEYVQPDTIRYATTIPNDANFNRQWSLANTGANNGLVGADIKATAAWDTRTDASGVIVAVIDSGVRLDHPDLAANLWRNPREVPGNGRDDDGNGYIDDVHGINAINNSGNPADDHGHGTHVAGIIGAVGDNGIGITGIAWRVQIMPLKFLRGSTGRGTTSDAIQCIDYAIAHGAHIINASYGAASNDVTQFDPAEFDAVRQARDAGIIFVAAAGNDGTDMDLLPHYPASFRLENVIAVANSTPRDDLPLGTNFGSGSVELFAPGTDIYSLSHLTSTLYVTRTGTSMSAPHVSGALALLKAHFPNDTYRQLINRILRNVDPVPALAGKAQTGGRLNVDRALRSTDSRPFNDDFATRARVSGSSLAIRTVNTGATTEAEPSIDGVAPTNSLWWEWVAPRNGIVRVSTDGSTYDTVLGVFTGSQLTSLTLVAANDNAAGRLTSRVEFTARAGTAYQIVVAGKAGGHGLTLLDLGAIPANDNFAGAEIITGRTALIEGTNVQATLEPGEPQIRGRTGGKSLWYRWTAPASGRFQFGLHSDGFDPLLAVYQGSDLNSLTLVDSSDDADAESGGTSAATGSLVTVNATAGTTYHIQVDGNARSGLPPMNARFTLTLNDSVWQGMAGASITCAPTVGPDGTVYVGSVDGFLHAFTANGARRWPAINLQGALLDTSAAALGPDGTLYFGSGPSPALGLGARLFAYNSATGEKKWDVVVGTGIGANNAVALGGDGTIYVHSDEGRLFAFVDQGTSAVQKWSLAVPGNSYASASIAADGTIYLGCDDTSGATAVHRLFAINPDGTTRWTFPVDNPIYTSAAIDAAGNVYFGTLGSGRLYSVSPTGMQRWVYRGASLGTSSSPALSPDGRTVYFGGYDGLLHAVDTSTGTARWTFRLGTEVRASSPAVDVNGVIYIGCYDGLVYAINADGTLNRTWSTGNIIRSSPAIAGRMLYVGSNDQRLYAFDTGRIGTSGPWSQYRQNAARTGRASPATFAVVSAPKSQTAVLGRPLELSVIVSGNGPFTYEWLKGGSVIPGATSSTYAVPSVSEATAGTYAVRISDPVRSILTDPFAITVEPLREGRLTNLSVRTTAGTAEQTLTVGFVLSGSPGKPVLVRAIGPSLRDFGVSDALSDPLLQLYSGDVVLTANDNWSYPSSGHDVELVKAAFTASGAFPLPSDSLDAAVVRSVGGGSYTAQISGASGSGIALAEIYDTDPAGGAKLVNVSARALVGTGNGILIAGFNVSGNVPRRLLVRGVGPALSAFGVAGALANPRLDIYRGDTLVESNDDWGGSPALASAFTRAGAFPLGTGTTRDAAVLVTLPPGSYTAQVSGVGATTGIALVEIYEMPE